MKFSQEAKWMLQDNFRHVAIPVLVWAIIFWAACELAFDLFRPTVAIGVVMVVAWFLPGIVLKGTRKLED